MIDRTPIGWIYIVISFIKSFHFWNANNPCFFECRWQVLFISPCLFIRKSSQAQEEQHLEQKRVLDYDSHDSIPKRASRHQTIALE